MTTAGLFKDIQLLVLDVDGVMTDGQAWQDISGQWRRLFSVRDSIGIRAVMKAGVRVAIVTDADSDLIRRHVQQLGVTDFFENSEDKGSVIDGLARRYGLGYEQIVFMSESLSDLALFQRLPCAVTVLGADAALRSAAHFVSRCRGGDGAVLEVCNGIIQQSGRLRRPGGARLKAGMSDPALSG